MLCWFCECLSLILLWFTVSLILEKFPSHSSPFFYRTLGHSCNYIYIFFLFSLRACFRSPSESRFVTIYIYIYIYIYVYEGWVKMSEADQDSFMECSQMTFIFQHSFPWRTHTSSISVAVLAFHCSPKITNSKYIIIQTFQLILKIYVCVCVCVCVYIYIYMYVCMSVCVYIYIYIYIYIYLCMYKWVCTYGKDFQMPK